VTTAIDIQGVSKRFRLYHEKYSSLKERVLHGGHVPYEEFWALNDISAEIPAGQTVGILGRNGSGKSTLLKCIAGILQPTSGQVVVRGQLAAMLELGAGFQPELSGRDNVYLNASLLGFSRREIDRRFDEIVQFAELEAFIDNQVKYYSSGMYVRLGFAVAVSVEPDILLVDEVLAVGDERFQEKCMDRVRRFQEEGRTIVVVSHSPDMMRQICDQILVLEKGRLLAQTTPGEAIRTFRATLIDAGLVAPDPGEAASLAGAEEVVVAPRRRIEITGTSVEHPGAGERPYLITGEPLTIRVAYQVHEPTSGVVFSLSVLNSIDSTIFASRSAPLGEGVDLPPGPGSVSFHFDSVPLLDGRFNVNLDVRDAAGTPLDLAEPAASFEVMNPTRATGLVALPMRVEMEPPTGVYSELRSMHR
jgi:ABC-2 type transport system ATP-binding protein